MTNLIEYIGQDYTYNIIDLDELNTPNPASLKLWHDLGFTQGLSDDGAIICSNAFDTMVRYLLHYKEDTKLDMSDLELVWSGSSTYCEDDRFFGTIVLPMIRRLFSRGVVIEPKKLQQLYNKLFPSIWRKYERMLESGAKIDAEAEATALLCQVITRRIKKNKKKRKQRRKYERHKN